MASSSEKLKGLFLIFDAGFRKFADGVELTNATATELYFMRHQFDSSGKSTYILFNPGPSRASVTATLYSVDGTATGAAETGTIPPRGQWSPAFDKVTASSGYVRVESTRPLFGLQVFGNRDELSALSAASPTTDARLFFPHFAVGGGYDTHIGIINTQDLPADISLRAYAADGRPLGPVAKRRLEKGAQLFEPVAGIFGIGAGSMQTGYVVAESGLSGLVGFTAFRFADGPVTSAAAVPAQPLPVQKLVFSHVAHDVPAGAGRAYRTGIALLNPFGAPVPYTMRVFDGGGRKVAELNDTLPPRARAAKMLSHPLPGAAFFTQPIALGSGHVEVVTPYGLLGFELFFTDDLSQLASVPAQTD
jgi:hypothetical protein